MKKIFTLLILSLFICTGIGYAYDMGWFQEPDKTVFKVSDAVRLRDDSFVTLKWNITKRTSNEKYLFKDSSGTIVVKIKDYMWAGQKVSADDLVEITGELDKDFTSVKIKANTVKKLK